MKFSHTSKKHDPVSFCTEFEISLGVSKRTTTPFCLIWDFYLH